MFLAQQDYAVAVVIIINAQNMPYAFAKRNSVLINAFEILSIVILFLGIIKRSTVLRIDVWYLD